MGRIGRLMANKKGPSEKKRKLFNSIIWGAHIGRRS